MKNSPKKGHGFIYKYTSPSGKSYIGQTVKTIEERARKGKGYMNCTLFWKAIQKYGFDKFDITVIGEFPVDHLNDLEVKYIEVYKTIAPHGYNILAGGNIVNNRKKVYQYDPETGLLLHRYSSVKEASSAIGVSVQTLSNCLNGSHPKSKGFFWSFIELKKYPIIEVTSNHSKTVFMYDLDGVLVNTFPSIGRAADFVNGERVNIRKACRNEIQTAYGYKWESAEVLHEKKYSNQARPIRQLDILTGDIIQTYPSISSAAKAFEKNGTSLFRRALNNPKYTAYGYKWEYV